MAKALTDATGGAERHRDATRAVQAGVDRYGAGDLEEAASELRRALRLWPEHPRARLYLGWVQRCLRLGATPEEAAAAPAEPTSAASAPLITRRASSPVSQRVAVPITPPAAMTPATGPPPPLSQDSPMSDMSDIELATSVEEALREATSHAEEPVLFAGPGDTPRPSDAAELEIDLGGDIEIETGDDLALDASPDDDDGDLNLSELVAEAAQWSEGAEEPPSLDEAGLISISDELLSDEARKVPSRAPRPVVKPAASPTTPGSRLSGPLMDVPAAGSGLSVLLADEPAARPRSAASSVGGRRAAPGSGLSDLLGGDRVAAPGSGLSSLFVDQPAGAGEGSGLSNLFVDAPAVPGGIKSGRDLSGLFSDLADRAVPEPKSGRSFGDLPPPLIDDLPLSDEPAVAPPEELLADDDIELLSEPPLPPAAKSPLVAEELFADIADPEPSQPSRPLVARPKASITPDFIVDFDDVISSEAESPGTFPPPPPRQKAPPQLEEAGRALGRGDAESAYRLVEGLIEGAGGDPAAAALRPYQGLLASIYEGMLRPLDRVPRTGRLPKDLEPASAFLLSLLDGSMSIEDALTVSGMERLRGARTLVALMRRGLLTF